MEPWQRITPLSVGPARGRRKQREDNRGRRVKWESRWNRVRKKKRKGKSGHKMKPWKRKNRVACRQGCLVPATSGHQCPQGQPRLRSSSENSLLSGAPQRPQSPGVLFSEANKVIWLQVSAGVKAADVSFATGAAEAARRLKLWRAQGGGNKTSLGRQGSSSWWAGCKREDGKSQGRNSAVYSYTGRCTKKQIVAVTEQRVGRQQTNPGAGHCRLRLQSRL